MTRPADSEPATVKIGSMLWFEKTRGKSSETEVAQDTARLIHSAAGQVLGAEEADRIRRGMCSNELLGESLVSPLVAVFAMPMHNVVSTVGRFDAESTEFQYLSGLLYACADKSPRAEATQQKITDFANKPENKLSEQGKLRTLFRFVITPSKDNRERGLALFRKEPNTAYDKLEETEYDFKLWSGFVSRKISSWRGGFRRG